MVRFTGILVAEPPTINCEVPGDLVPVNGVHITLLSSELTSEVRRELRSADLSALPAFPTVTMGESYIADNGARRTLVCDVNEQDLVRGWLEAAIDQLGIPVLINPSRVWHVSVANRTGSPHDSIPDPWNHRG